MLCPVDNSELRIESVGGYQVHRCAQCLGAALGGNLVREVRAYAALQLHKMQGNAASVGPCPVDAKPMIALEYKGVSLCACSQCLGLWLTADQLAQLLELVGPPKQADLSKIGQGLPTIPSAADSSSLDGVREILQFSADVIDGIGAIGKLID